MPETKTIANSGPPPSVPARPAPIVPPAQPVWSAPPVVAPGAALTPGKGNLLYVSTHKGLAKCVMAYGTNGTDGAPVWSSMNGSGGGLLGNLVIRWFNLDPFSQSGDHFTAGWAMTDGGLYRVTGLPTTPVWTLQLTAANACTLTGDTVVLPYTFSPSVRQAGFIMVAAVNTVYKYKIYTLYSTDYGATWNCTASNYVISSDAYNTYIVPRLQALVSFHLDNIQYWAGGLAWRGDQDHAPDYSNTPTPAIERSAGLNLLKFTPGLAIGNYAEGRRMYNPYCNASGVVYSNDNQEYFFNYDGSSGAGAIQRMISAFSPLWSAGYTPPTIENLGDAAMPQIRWLFSNMWNENYGVAIDAANIWLTTNLAGATPTWTRKQNPTISSRLLRPTYLFCVPASGNIVFFTGSRTSGGTAGYGMPCFTPDLGATLIDISKPGAADGIDTIMSLTATTDMDDSTIIIDYFKI